MPDSPVITLTTDFGYEDHFAGVMKGVILTMNPGARIVDITHGIRPFNVVDAAYTIGLNFRYFPPDSIHVVVVDPGVGSARRPIAVLADGHYFVGPDNGVFSYVYRDAREYVDVVHITAAHHFLSPVSRTFQGRDVFAPVAAWLSRGLAMEKLGETITDYVKLGLPEPSVTDDGALEGEVVSIDRFGNAATNITESDMKKLGDPVSHAALRITLADREVPLMDFYRQGDEGSLCGIINSSGLLEFFVTGGSAEERFHIAPGDRVRILSS